MQEFYPPSFSFLRYFIFSFFDTVKKKIDESRTKINEKQKLRKIKKLIIHGESFNW